MGQRLFALVAILTTTAFPAWAKLTLRRVGSDPETLVTAVQKVTRFNQLREAVESSARYVSLKDRVQFIRAVAGLPWN